MLKTDYEVVYLIWVKRRRYFVFRCSIKLKLQQNADSVNDATALTFDTFTEGWFALMADLEEVEDNVILGNVPNMTEGIVNFDTIAGTVLTRTVLIDLTAGTMRIGGLIVDGLLGMVAAEKLPNYFLDKALKERENQFKIFNEEIISNDKGLGAIINDIMKQFEDKGWEPLNSSDGENIDFILEYRSTSSEERRQLFYKRLYREMAIRCNRWWIKNQ